MFEEVDKFQDNKDKKEVIKRTKEITGIVEKTASKSINNLETVSSSAETAYSVINYGVKSSQFLKRIKNKKGIEKKVKTLFKKMEQNNQLIDEKKEKINLITEKEEFHDSITELEKDIKELEEDQKINKEEVEVLEKQIGEELKKLGIDPIKFTKDIIDVTKSTATTASHFAAGSGVSNALSVSSVAAAPSCLLGLFISSRALIKNKKKAKKIAAEKEAVLENLTKAKKDNNDFMVGTLQLRIQNLDKQERDNLVKTSMNALSIVTAVMGTAVTAKSIATTVGVAVGVTVGSAISATGIGALALSGVGSCANLAYLGWKNRVHITHKGQKIYFGHKIKKEVKNIRSKEEQIEILNKMLKGTEGSTEVLENLTMKQRYLEQEISALEKEKENLLLSLESFNSVKKQLGEYFSQKPNNEAKAKEIKKEITELVNLLENQKEILDDTLQQVAILGVKIEDKIIELDHLKELANIAKTNRSIKKIVKLTKKEKQVAALMKTKKQELALHREKLDYINNQYMCEKYIPSFSLNESGKTVTVNDLERFKEQVFLKEKDDLNAFLEELEEFSLKFTQKEVKLSLENGLFTPIMNRLTQIVK